MSCANEGEEREEEAEKLVAKGEEVPEEEDKVGVEKELLRWEARELAKDCVFVEIERAALSLPSKAVCSSASSILRGAALLQSEQKILNQGHHRSALTLWLEVWRDTAPFLLLVGQSNSPDYAIEFGCKYQYYLRIPMKPTSSQ